MRTTTRLVSIGLALTLLAGVLGHAQGRRSRSYGNRNRRSEADGSATTRANNATQAGAASASAAPASATPATNSSTPAAPASATPATNSSLPATTAGAAPVSAAPATSSIATAASTDFQRFAIIMQRNIFNKNRVRPLSADELAKMATPAQVQPVIQDIDLVGTWIFDQRKVAFVQGDQAAPNGQTTPGDLLGGWKIVEITTDGVTLTKDNAQMSLRVGQRLERVNQGEWKAVNGLSRANAVASTRQGPRSAANANASASDNGGSGFGQRGNRGMDFGGGPDDMGGPGDMGGGPSRGGANAAPSSTASATPSADVIRKMMERRQQEAGNKK